MNARDSGEPAAIGRASERVIALALVEMAKLRLDEKSYGDAISLCMESLAFEETAETRVEIAIASLYARKPAEAVKQATSAAELEPRNALAWTIKGEALLQVHDFPHAVEALSRSLELDRAAEPMYALGAAQLGNGEKQKAGESFSRFLSLVGDSGWSRVLVGRAYRDRGLLQEAETEFQKALILDPATPNAHYFWALTLMQAKAWKPDAEVYSHLRAELRLNPRHFEANYVLGSLASAERNYQESDRYLHLAAQVNPSVAETWILLGLNAQRRNSIQAAIAYFRKAIDLGKNLDPQEHFEVRRAYFNLGRLLISSGKTKEGEALLSKARELQAQSMAQDQKSFATMNRPAEEGGIGAEAPYIPASDSGRQSSLFPPSANPGAREESSLSARTGSHSPTDPQGKNESYLGTVLGASFNDLATAEALQEKYKAAFDHYKEAARWDSRIPGLQRNLGLAAYYADQPSEAIRLLSKVVVQTPDDAHARAVLALAYFSSGDFSKTVQTILPITKQALQDPQLALAFATSQDQTGNSTASQRVLNSLETSGKLLEAIQQFEHVIQAQPSNLAYHLGLQAAYRKAGRAAAADQQQSICESLRAEAASRNSSTREKKP